jgi:hypothetical protein
MSQNPSSSRSPVSSKEEEVKMLVTPKIASEWLAIANVDNRNLRAPKVQDLARVMLRDRFKYNGDAVRFDRDGRLLDGQHRLGAIVESGCSQTMLVVFGLDPDVWPTIDIGTKRTAGDALTREKVGNGKGVAATCKLVVDLLAIESGQMSFTNLGRIGRTPDAIVEWWKEDLGRAEHITECVRAVGAFKEGKRICRPPALFSALRWRIGCVDRAEADAFFDLLAKGVGFSGPNDPTSMLRNFLIDDQLSKGRGRRPPWYLAAVTFKCWNARRRDKPVRHLAFRTQGRPESWPVPV